MSSLSTDFNVSPYFDDYDEDKKYYRILFRPSVAVQARELTQLQTMQQNQIQRLGNEIFKDGAVVEGCSPSEIPNLDFVRVEDNFTANANAFITEITNEYLLVGQSSNVRAVSIVSKAGALLNYPDTNRFYVRYLTTGVNELSTFSNGEVINIYNLNQNKLGPIDSNNFINTINVISTNASINAIGKGYGLRIENGIIYHKGFLQTLDDQTIIVKNYDQNVANYVVGFETTESIVTENEDETLTDNALGYPNENAPGAHRLKLVPQAVAKDRTAIANNETFFAVFEFSNITNNIVLDKRKTPYDDIGQFLNERTYDESGDYVVKPFTTETIEGSTSNTFKYMVSTGKGYIHGSLVEYNAPDSIETDRATTTIEANAQIITTNYGNYVFVKEYAGALNYNNFITVDLYDAAFNAVTNRFTPSLAGKNKIGQAKVKSVVHHEGDPGSPNTTYRVFLTDIVMNSGESFSSDVKSIYANTAVNPYGAFYADIDLIGSKALIQESGKTNLVFPFGKKALKTLRSANGSINATQFYFRATSNAVMQTNGFITVTTASSYTGGVDRIGYSPGDLGDTLEDQFIVALTSNVSTANIGTVNLNSTNTTIITSGLDTRFANNEFIKIYANASTIDFRRVVAVNATAMVIDALPSTTNTAAAYAKHFPAGYTIPLDDSTYPGTRKVTVTSNTTFQVSTGAAFSAALESTANVAVQYRMLRTQATQAKKDVNKNRYIKLFANSSVNNIWNLGIPDVYNLKKVYANSAGYSESDNDDITNYFSVDSGQRDDFYDHAKLVLKPQYVGTLGNKYLTVIVDHFSANLNNGVGFFSVDSYPVDANTANTNAIQIQEIPLYVSDNRFIDLRDAVDFRAYKTNTAVSATTLAAATANPATTNTFISYSANYLAEPDTNFQSNIEYYLGRIDLITMNSSGGLGVIKGTPSENPKQPFNDSDTMILASADVPPYPTLTSREAELYKRYDYAIRTRLSTNRVYTMRDIGVLDQRIQRLEYYTTLNQLEQQAQNIQVPDANGLNRFKNGIFADPMTSHIFAESGDIEYRYSIDTGLGFGRPLFSSENVDLTYVNATSTNVVATNKYITKPYTHELFVFQPFATKVRNNTQEFWAWSGKVDLFPNYDMNKDETRLPNVDASIDLTSPFINFANLISSATGATIFGTRWGDWRTTDSTTTRTQIARNLQEIKTTTNQVRQGTNTFVVPMSNTFSLGSFVTDISVQPYMKSRTIAFIARNLKPNTKVYAFFDNTPVSQHCAAGTLNFSLGANANEIIAAAATLGNPSDAVVRSRPFPLDADPPPPVAVTPEFQPSDLITDEYGNLYGLFRIPAGQFRTGDRLFQLMDADSIITGNDAALTRATATYTASNIAVSTRNATITTVTPEIRQISLTDKRVSIDVTYIEPLAQSFLVESPEGQSGVFLTKIDLFFKKKDPNLGIEVVVLGMTNGVPDYNLVYGSARLDAANVTTSDDANTPSTFTFNNPIFLSANKFYAFYVWPEANSPEYQMWVSETGFFDVKSGAQVYKNPYCGDVFRSSNAKTWTPLPKEDFKFNLYVANFEVGTGVAYFENEKDEYITFNSLAIANSAKPVSVGDEVYIVNSASNAAIVNTSISGVVQFIDTTTGKMKLDNSTGGFSNGNILGVYRFAQQGNTAQANSFNLVGTAAITTIDNPVLHSIVPRFAAALPSGTTIDYQFKGTSNSAVIEGTFNEITNDSEREMLDFERRVYSYSPQLNAGIGKTLTIKANLTNSNKYVSPVIDLSRKSALVIKNIINNDSTNEHTRYGNSIAKYISQPIILADGQEAEDLKIYLSAYRPINTDVEVYVKFLNDADPDILSNKVWTKLVLENPELRSSPIDIYNFNEFVYNVPTTAPVTYGAFKNASNFGIVQYTDASGVIYQSFKTFAIKIVLLSSDGIYVPKVNDLRGIALQV